MPPTPQRLVLVVDDDPYIAFIFQRAFEGQEDRFLLDIAMTVELALQKIKVMFYDMIFLDMKMGAPLAGMQVLEELRTQEIKLQAEGQMFLSTTVIIMTGSIHFNEFTPRARELEAYHIIDKPVPMTEEFVRRVVNRFGLPLLPRRSSGS